MQSAKAAVVLKCSYKLTFAISIVFDGIAHVYFFNKYNKLSVKPFTLSEGSSSNSAENFFQS